MTEDQLPAEIRLIIERIAPGRPEVLEVSPGWYPLLGLLNERLAAIAPGYVVLQCKSKFGSLRFHAQPAADPSIYIDEFNQVIRDAEWASMKTCEECAAPAKQYARRLWVVTLCAQHADEVADGAIRPLMAVTAVGASSDTSLVAGNLPSRMGLVVRSDAGLDAGSDVSSSDVECR